MAYEADLKIIPGLVAAADLSAKQFTFVNVDSNGAVAANTTEGEVVAGVLQDAPDAAGKTASPAYAGITKVVLGATVAAGADVMSDTSGRAIAATTGKFIRGKLLEGGDADEIGTLLLGPTGYSL